MWSRSGSPHPWANRARATAAPTRPVGRAERRNRFPRPGLCALIASRFAMASAVSRLLFGAAEVITEAELQERAARRPLRVKLGIDPSAPHVTMGWAVPLRKLRQFQDAGHTAVLIVGEFTARVGDPSGKSETRPR